MYMCPARRAADAKGRRRAGTDAPYQYRVQGHNARVCSGNSPQEPPFANALSTILPRPFPRGEGKGEGSVSVGRSGVQCAKRLRFRHVCQVPANVSLSRNSQITHVFELLQEVPFVNDESDARKAGANTKYQIQCPSLGGKIGFQFPYAKTESQHTGGSNKNQMKRFQ